MKIFETALKEDETNLIDVNLFKRYFFLSFAYSRSIIFLFLGIYALIYAISLDLVFAVLVWHSRFLYLWNVPRE